MATDQGGKRGPQSSRGDNHGSSRSDGRGRFRNGYDDRDRDRDSNQRDAMSVTSSNPNPNTIGVPPPVPGFGFNFANMPNGMPMFPPGFMMPTNQPQQQQQAPGNE
jgi:protein NRD1